MLLQGLKKLERKNERPLQQILRREAEMGLRISEKKDKSKISDDHGLAMGPGGKNQATKGKYGRGKWSPKRKLIGDMPVLLDKREQRQAKRVRSVLTMLPTFSSDEEDIDIHHDGKLDGSQGPEVNRGMACQRMANSTGVNYNIIDALNRMGEKVGLRGRQWRHWRE
ncbi:hypothetical protein J437_LFUL012112 [Ladona fulva]|uniref:Uncharacterized protein n=1 Tax=Ladona fulva TaxID=123851 RepID=A0A8K0KEA9_LADFU|nr:hypothetical protein J437_LFUL012112 [Ladona fulva]